MIIKTKLQIGRILTHTIPILCSIIFLIHCILDFYDIEFKACNYIGGTSILMWVYLLYNSYMYNLCVYHRMFIYYLICSNCISIIDTYYGIPITDAQYLSVFVIGFGTAVLLYGYLKFKENKKARN